MTDTTIKLSHAADLMRREFFRVFPTYGDPEMFILMDWDDLPPEEQQAWERAFRFVYEQHLEAERAKLERRYFALLERHGFALESLRGMVDMLESMGNEKSINVKIVRRFLENQEVKP